MSNETGNVNFKVVQNTLNDSKVFQGLVDAGILPQNFAVLQGTAEPTAAGDYAVVGADGNTLQIPAGAVIVSAVTLGVGLVGGTNALVGLALTDGGAFVDSILTATTTAVLIAGGTVATSLPAVAANQYVTTTTTGTFTAGVVKVTIIIA